MLISHTWLVPMSQSYAYPPVPYALRCQPGCDSTAVDLRTHHKPQDSQWHQTGVFTAQTLGGAAIPLTSVNAGGDVFPRRHGPSSHRHVGAVPYLVRPDARTK